MPRIPSFPNSSCGAPHVPVSASEDIKLQIMAARLQEQLQNEFAEKADLKTINNESLLVSADGSSNININGIVDIKKTATEGLIDTYTITFTDASTAIFTVRNGQDGKSLNIKVTAADCRLPGDAYIDENGHFLVLVEAETTTSEARFEDVGNIRGPQGEIGPQGPQGPVGPKGEIGATGPVGSQGPKGEKGDIGATGPQGPKGDKGEKGDTGAQGPVGEKGDKGDTGPQGLPGEKGDKGDKGDAFTYADFTEEQLEALRGPQGIQGEQGEQGPAGLDGYTPIKGIDYFDGEKGEKGDAFTYQDFTTEQLEALRGPQGIQGIQGEPGKNGIDGVTPHIENGNWFIGTEDTGVTATGPQGESGANGQDGISPTITTTSITGGTRVTISDVNGSESFDILNGIDGNSADVPTKVSELENDVGYITLANVPKTDLSDYYNKNETETLINEAVNGITIPDTSNFITMQDVEDKGYLTEHQDISGKADVDHKHTLADIEDYSAVDLEPYALKTDIPSIEGLATETFVKDAIAEAELGDKEVDLTGYATKDELSAVESKIPSIDGLATETFVTESINNIQPTDLSNYYNKTETENLVDDAVKAITVPEVPTNVSAFTNDANYTTLAEVATQGYLTSIPDDYVTAEELAQEGFLKEHQSLEDYATKDFVTTKIAEAELANKEVDLSNYYTKTEVDGLIPDISTKADKSDLEGLATETFVTEAIAKIEPVDLSEYAKLTDIPDVSKFITEIPADYVTETELESKGYITEHQDLSDYALKTDIPDTSNFATLDLLAIKADDIPFTTDRVVGKAIGGFVIGESVKGLTVAQLFAKLLELSDETESKGIIETIIANKTPMYQVNESGELVEIPFIETLDLTANANVDATVSGFYQIKDETGTVIESGYQHDSAINDSMYYVIALPKELIFGENLSIQTWSVMDNQWVEVNLEMSSDPVFIAEAFAEGDIPVPAIDTSIYTLWIDATLNTCAGTSYRFIINE